VLLSWCNETAGSTTPEDLAYDVAYRSFPLARTGCFAIASMASIVGRYSISRNSGCGDRSGLLVYTTRP
jgi:hypothetical protein